MIVSELIENGNRIRHYSNEGFKILQNETGIIYDDAVDVVPCRYTYEETDESICNGEENNENEYIAIVKDVM